MEIVKSKYVNAAIAENPEILADIHNPAVNIAIFQRSPVNFQKEVLKLIEKEVNVKANGSISDITQKMQAWFHQSGIEASNIQEDIIWLLNEFKQLSKETSFKLLFTVVNTNMCRKFHTDVNFLRLLCTYEGKGTLWLPDEVVNQKQFNRRGINDEITVEEHHIQRADSGDVLILKGALYPNSKAVVHRSPTIEEEGKKRLLLRIDTNQSIYF